ncbi:MAG: DUF438 domain-containing protein [Sedimentisphaerales bacterium]|nr:DUF438 domain-containing protein [Sedimentisphaerales bacterium]
MSELIDNRAKRIQTLKEIVQKLHHGAKPEEVRSQLTEIVRHASPGEIAAMEQQLMAEGVTVNEIKSMCDLHAAVVQDILTKQAGSDVQPGHPVDTFRVENEAIRRTLDDLSKAMVDLAALPADAEPGLPLRGARQAANDLMDVDKHYQRKENLLFSFLERHGITGPSKVMWGKDDEARGALKTLQAALRQSYAKAGHAAAALKPAATAAAEAIGSMIDKEESILLPMSLQTLTEDEWGQIWQQSPEYGWCLVEPRAGYAPPESLQAQETVELPHGRSVAFPAGSLTFEQLVGVFSTLPVDLTFVDAEDRVRFFSESSGRIFARSKAIMGRKVQHCHPPDSVDVVERILDDFRSGRQSVAEFWINLHGRFVHIRYFAVRDPKGEYLGTLEVTQDLTPLRALEGERRLLQYDTPGT